jgi:Flp pilus assembly protein TadD
MAHTAAAHADYSRAVEHARQALAVDPEFWVVHMQLGQALERLGETDLALQSLSRAEQLSGGNSKPVSTKGYVLAKTGRADDARAVLNDLITRSRTQYVPMYAIALVHTGLGDREACSSLSTLPTPRVLSTSSFCPSTRSGNLTGPIPDSARFSSGAGS